MAISKCLSLSVENKIERDDTDSFFQINETGHHGTPEFPVAIYLDDVSNEYVNWHWHEEFEIGFVTEGFVVLGSGNRTYQMKQGDVFFVNSNILHSMRNQGTSDHAIFKSIAFHSSLISESTNSIFYKKYLFPILSDGYLKECIISKGAPSHQTTLDLLTNVWDMVNLEIPDYEIKVRNDLSTLFCILNELREHTKGATFPKVQNYQSEKRVKILLDYIHSHLKEKITIGDLAKSASISKTEVIRCFKAIMGQSPINYLNDYRLKKASYLLVNSEKNVQEIAEECGFDDNSYFSKLFKRKYHVTPHDYRFKN